MGAIECCFLSIREGDQVTRYELGPEARYVQDYELIRVWDNTHTFVLHPSNLVALCVKNQGPVASKRQ